MIRWAMIMSQQVYFVHSRSWGIAEQWYIVNCNKICVLYFIVAVLFLVETPHVLQKHCTWWREIDITFGFSTLKSIKFTKHLPCSWFFTSLCETGPCDVTCVSIWDQTGYIWCSSVCSYRTSDEFHRKEKIKTQIPLVVKHGEEELVDEEQTLC